MHLSSRRPTSNQLTINRSRDCSLERRELLTIEFATTDVGPTKGIGMYISDGRASSDVSVSVDRAGNYLQGLRLGGVQGFALLADGSLSREAKLELNEDIKALQKIPGNPGAIVLASNSDSKVHSSYRQSGNANKISGEAWAAMFRAVLDHVQSKGVPILALEPLNEPDVGGKLGDKSDWNSILSKFQADPVLTNYPIMGPSTVEPDNYQSWFDATKDNIDWGASHWIRDSSLKKWKDFILDTQAAGKQAFASEVHRLVELITGAEYGLAGGTFWQTVTESEAKFTEASTNGTRVGYEENNGKDAAAAAYKLNNENKVYVFVGNGPKNEAATFNFRVTDRDVMVDGQFVSAGEVFKVTSNAPEGAVVEVTW